MSRAESLTDIARTDALRSISRARWAAFGILLSSVPLLNVVLLGVGVGVASVLTPKIDLSSSERLERYFQNPASYTLTYCRTAKRQRGMWIFYGWLAGVVISNLFR